MNGSIGGGLYAIIYCYVIRKRVYQGKIDIPTFSYGILGGLVGITAICAVCKPREALLIGFMGAAVAIGGKLMIMVTRTLCC